MSEKVTREEKATVAYVQCGEVATGVVPSVPAGLVAPAVTLLYAQAGRRLLARFGRTADGGWRLEYVREID